ncbi:MAG: CocE/NonD family hydrolase [Thermoplasmatota archaeon]
MKWRSLAALLLMIPLAGCLDGGDEGTGDGQDLAAPFGLDALSAVRFDILPVVEELLPASDGVQLHHAVYRPDTDEPVPVFINFSPYWGDTAEEGGDPFARYMVSEYVPRGYAVVLAAIRGTGHSGGCFEIAGDREVQDLYEVIDHYANVDWSNGNIGVGGKSYDSTTQNGLIAKNPHPALKAVFHVSGITDMYAYNYYHGVPSVNGLAFTPRYYASFTLDEYMEPQDEDAASLLRLVEDVACPEAVGHVASGTGSALHGMKDAYWIERDWKRSIADSDWEGGLFFVHGLQDWNVKPDHITDWVERLPDGIEVTGWLHQWQESGTGHVYPMRTDWNLTMLRWLDHWLKGIDTGLLGEPRYEVQGTDGLWRATETWPLPADQWVTLDPDTDNDRGGFAIPLFSFNETLRYSGSPILNITATSLNPDPVISATLWSINPGTGELVWMNEAVLRATLRDGLEGPPSPVLPGVPVEYSLTFYPQEDVLPPGHIWIVSVGDAPTRTFAPLAPTGVTYDLESATIHLPLVMGDEDLMPVQPTPMRCFAC